MRIIKQIDPITVAKYTQDHGLTIEPGFKRAKKYGRNPHKFIFLSRILASQSNGLEKFKFGVQVPKRIRQALSFYMKNNNGLWGEAMKKEMVELMKIKTFIIVDDIGKIPKAYQYIPAHFVFDIKVDGRHKARLCTGGDLTDPDVSEIYSSVVGIENVRVLFLIADLNDLEIVVGDICNAYLF